MKYTAEILNNQYCVLATILEMHILIKKKTEFSQW